MENIKSIFTTAAPALRPATLQEVVAIAKADATASFGHAARYCLPSLPPPHKHARHGEAMTALAAAGLTTNGRGRLTYNATFRDTYAEQFREYAKGE